MREHIELGSSPWDEDCVQVITGGNYLDAMRAECLRYIDTIRLKLGPEKGSARLSVRSYPHDFGTYLEVVASYDPEDAEGAVYAWLCEERGPRTWDDVNWKGSHSSEEADRLEDDARSNFSDPLKDSMHEEGL